MPESALLRHPLLHAMKAEKVRQRLAAAASLGVTLTAAQMAELVAGQTVGLNVTLPLTITPPAVSPPPPPPPPPPPNGAPPLPSGPIVVNGTTIPAATYKTTFGGSSTAPPTGMYWFQSNNPGAGDNAIWPGNLAVPSSDGLKITTEMQNGKVASGGAGCTNALAQTGAMQVADFSIFYGDVVPNLVRYGLWWPMLGWPGHEEDDMIEGWPGASRMTWHGLQNNTAVGHILQSALSSAGVWYAIRCIRVPGTSGYLQTLVGPDWDHLTLQSGITASQLPPGAVFDGTPHVFDIAVEAEGPVSLSAPVTDKIGGLALYELAA